MDYSYSGYPFDALESESKKLTERHWDLHPTSAHDAAVAALRGIFGALLPEDFSINYIIVARGETSPLTYHQVEDTCIDTSEWDCEIPGKTRDSVEYRQVKDDEAEKISEILTTFENSITH